MSKDVGGVEVRVAALEDIVRSKSAAGREKDNLVLPALRRLLDIETGERRARRKPKRGHRRAPPTEAGMQLADPAKSNLDDDTDWEALYPVGTRERSVAPARRRVA